MATLLLRRALNNPYHSIFPAYIRTLLPFTVELYVKYERTASHFNLYSNTVGK